MKEPERAHIAFRVPMGTRGDIQGTGRVAGRAGSDAYFIDVDPDTEEQVRATRIVVHERNICPGCLEGLFGDLAPHHFGSRHCESGSIASGGKIAHCTCDYCF